MGHPRRKFVHNRAYFVTNRLAEGLPLVPAKIINKLLFGLLARARVRKQVGTFRLAQSMLGPVIQSRSSPAKQILHGVEAVRVFIHNVLSLIYLFVVLDNMALVITIRDKTKNDKFR